jgi:hypothetical protein
MSDTLPNITVTTTPQSLTVLSAGAVATGIATRVQNLGQSVVYYAISATLPDKTGIRRMPTEGYGNIIEFPAGENDIWFWSGTGTSVINAELA